VIISLLSLSLMFYLLRGEAKLKEYPVTFSVIIYVLILLNHMIPLLRSRSKHLATVEYGSFVIFNIIAVHSIFPLSKNFTILLSGLISLKNIFLLSYFLFQSEFSYEFIIKKVSRGFDYFSASVCIAW
jgi:hypothetical protein